MAMTEAQRKQVEDWFRDKKFNLDCPVCGANDWNLTGTIIGLPTIEEGKLQVGGTTIPMIQFVCGNCAHVRLFGAKRMGLVE